MDRPLTEILPLPQRLALAYAPRSARPATLGLLALDARLGQAVAQASEPITAQLRLAWWRDRFAGEVKDWPRGEYLLDLLGWWEAELPALADLVDGWELLLGERLTIADARAFAEARGRSFAALARLLGCGEEPARIAGTRWAWADLAQGMRDPGERNMVLEEGRKIGEQRVSMPKEMRSLLVLDDLAIASLANGGSPLLVRPRSFARAVRLGIFGR